MSSSSDQVPPLVRACAGGDISAISAAIAAHASKLNARVARFSPGFPYGATALTVAAARGHEDVCLRLLDAGADPTLYAPYEGTLLSIAAKMGMPRVVARLISAYELPSTELSAAVALAAADGHADICTLLLDAGAGMSDGTTLATALRHASLHRMAVVCIRLLLLTPDGSDLRRDAMSNVLSTACAIGDAATLAAVLAQGADALLLSDSDLLTRCSLGAARSGEPAVLKTLLAVSHAALDTPQCAHASPLLAAVQHRRTAMAMYILGQHPLHAQPAPVRLNVADGDTGRSPLMYAIAMGMTPVATALVSAGASLDARDGNGDTAVTIAVQMDDMDALRALVAAGANSDVRVVSGGRTPLMAAALHDDAALCMQLLDIAVDGHAVDTAGSTAVHHACRNGSVAALRVLLDRIPGAATASTDATSPLMLALSNTGLALRLDLLQMLLCNGADPNQLSHSERDFSYTRAPRSLLCTEITTNVVAGDGVAATELLLSWGALVHVDVFDEALVPPVTNARMPPSCEQYILRVVAALLNGAQDFDMGLLLTRLIRAHWHDLNVAPWAGSVMHAAHAGYRTVCAAPRIKATEYSCAVIAMMLASRRSIKWDVGEVRLALRCLQLGPLSSKLGLMAWARRHAAVLCRAPARHIIQEFAVAPSAQ